MKEINLLECLQKLWIERKLLIKVTGIAVVVGIIIAFSLPKVYTVTVTLSPEATRNNRSSLSSMAAMLGFGNMMGNDANALNVTMTGEIVSSTPFVLELFNTPVQTLDGQMNTTLVGYLASQRLPWWGTVLGLPAKAIGGIRSLFSEENNENKTEETINPFQLTKSQMKQVKAIRRILTAAVDKKTGITQVGVTVQDPLVAATVADTVVAKIQKYITDYKVSKAREDCRYWEQLYQERQKEYHEAQEKYAKYADANQGIVRQSVKIEQERLMNEVNLSLQMFTQVSTQLQMAKAKVQEEKPAFAVLEPATVPLFPSGTSRKTILLGVVFLAIIGASFWILVIKDIWNTIKNEWIKL